VQEIGAQAQQGRGETCPAPWPDPAAREQMSQDEAERDAGKHSKNPNWQKKVVAPGVSQSVPRRAAELRVDARAS
jgi:hypothetical protein